MVVCASALVVTLDNLILNVALPTLVDEVHATTAELQWIVDAYTIVFAGLLLVGGNLADRFGRVKTLRAGLLIFGAASAAAAWSGSASALIAWRAVMGIGAALVLPSSLSIIANLFTEPRARARAFGAWSAIGGVGLVLGPVVGGILLSTFWWGSLFLVNVPIVLFAVFAGAATLPESRNERITRIDRVGVVLSVAGVAGLLWATIEAPTVGWTSTVTVWRFGVAVALLVCFVAWELQCRHPMLEVRLFRDRRFSTSSWLFFTANFAIGGMLFVVTQILQSVSGYSPFAAGIRTVPFAIGFIGVSHASPRLVERAGARRVVCSGLALLGSGLALLAAFGGRSGYLPVAIAILAAGSGFGMVNPAITEVVVGSLPRESAGMGAGISSTTKQVGTAVGVAVIGSVLASHYQSEVAQRTRPFALAAHDAEEVRGSLRGALGIADRLGADGHAVGEVARHAFVDASRVAMFSGAGLALLGAFVAWRLLPRTEPST